MPKNLKEKLSLVLSDCETLPRYELIERLQRVIVEELSFLSAEHIIDSKDLSLIRSTAISNYSDLNLSEDSLGRIHGDGDAIRHLCLTQAVISLLRSKGLINFRLTFNKK